MQRLATLLTRNLPKTATSSTPDTLLAPSDKIDGMIVLDRRVDMITPLLTQLTYEGLIDEVMGIKSCTSFPLYYLPWPPLFPLFLLLPSPILEFVRDNFF